MSATNDPPVTCVIADPSNVRATVVEAMLNAHPQITVAQRVRSLGSLKRWFEREDVDTFLIDGDLAGGAGEIDLGEVPAEVRQKILLLVPTGTSRESLKGSLEGLDFVTRPRSPFEMEGMTMQLVNSLVAAYVVRKGTFPGNKAVADSTDAPPKDEHLFVGPLASRFVLVLLGNPAIPGNDDWLAALGRDRRRTYLLWFNLPEASRNQMVVRCLFEHRMGLTPARPGERLSLGRVYVHDGSNGVILSRHEDGQGLQFGASTDHDPTSKYSAFDLMVASFARLLRSQLCCIVAGHNDPDSVLKGIQCVRRMGGLVLIPDKTSRVADRLIQQMRDDPSPYSRFDPGDFPSLLGPG